MCDVLAGLLFGILSNFASRIRPGRDSVVLIGYVAQTVAFYLIFLTFPADSPLQESQMKPYFTSRLCSHSTQHSETLWWTYYVNCVGFTKTWFGNSIFIFDVILQFCVCCCFVFGTVAYIAVKLVIVVFCIWFYSCCLWNSCPCSLTFNALILMVGLGVLSCNRKLVVGN